MEKKKNRFEFKLNKIYTIANEKQWDKNSEFKCKIYLNDEKIGTVVYLNDNQDDENNEEDNDNENDSLIHTVTRKIEIPNIQITSDYELRIDCKNLGMLSRYSKLN